MRAIDADDLILHLTICQQNGMPKTQFYAIDDVIHYVKTMPTVEPERKTGLWIDDDCSECGHYVFRGAVRNYCPNCGAKMNGVVKHNG